MRILIIASLFLCLAQPLLSEEEVRYYDIELVVFENLDKNTDINEVWPTGKALQVPDNAAILGRKYEGKLPAKYDPRFLFTVLPAEDYQLNNEADAIKASDQYHLLLHTAWRQPGLPKNEAVTVYFNQAISDSDANPPPAEEPAPTPPPGAATPPSAQPAAAATTPPGVVANLEGLVTVVLSRFLHLDVEMLYKKHTESDTVNMFDADFLEDRHAEASQFYLKQNRKMRSKETHYIDNPVFSMLVRITPYEAPPRVAPAAAVTTGSRPKASR